MTIIWCMVPKIWSATDIIFCHSGLLFALLPLYEPRKSKYSKKWKSTWRYYHFTNINDSHMMYGSSDMECYRQNFLSFWTVRCSFTPITTQKKKILKKWKNCLEILSFYTGLTEMRIIWCMVLEITSTADRIFLWFWTIFCPFTPIWKNEKNT